MLGSLNKVVEQFTALPITNQSYLQECLELIFEKAVQEPEFNVTYVKMVKLLINNVRQMLNSLCQAEFKKQDISRRRKVGSILLIGQLYIAEMINLRNIHHVIRSLLSEKSEDGMECLCKLITTVGQALDRETKQKLRKGPQNDLLKKITKEKKVCSLMTGVFEPLP